MLKTKVPHCGINILCSDSPLGPLSPLGTSAIVAWNGEESHTGTDVKRCF